MECQDLEPAAVLTAVDNCDAGFVDVSFSETRVDGSCENEFTLTRTWSMMDECGNTNEHIQVVHVQDTTPPVYAGIPEIVVPAHEYVVGGAYPPDTPWEDLGDLGEVPSWYRTTAQTSWNTPSMRQLRGMCAAVSSNFEGTAATYIRTYLITDACGNVGESEVIIRLEDVTLLNLTSCRWMPSTTAHLKLSWKRPRPLTKRTTM